MRRAICSFFFNVCVWPTRKENKSNILLCIMNFDPASVSSDSLPQRQNSLKRILSRTSSSTSNGTPFMSVLKSPMEVDDNFNAFHDMVYCGRKEVESPVSEGEASRCIADLFPERERNRIIDLIVPKDSRGALSLCDAESEEIVERFPVRNVLFCARGTNGHKECVAFTVVQHRVAERPQTFICHVLHVGCEQKVSAVWFGWSNHLAYCKKLKEYKEVEDKQIWKEDTETGKEKEKVCAKEWVSLSNIRGEGIGKLFL